MLYFDWTSTSPVSSEALKEYCKTSENYYGNPSSTHKAGLEAKAKLEECRRRFASVLKVQPANLYFTSGGTEADSIVIQSLLNNPSPGEVLFTAVEHAAVLENKAILEKHGWKVTLLGCPDGYLSLDALKKALNPSVRMVCIMKVNNVTGTIMDTKEAVKIIRDYSAQIGKYIHIHCDAVQALGKIQFYPSEEGFDSAAFSSHKFSGPRGVGALWCTRTAVQSLSKAGGQESGLRGGTENLPAIAAMTVALENCIADLHCHYDYVVSLRKKVESCATELGFKLLSPASDSGKEFSPYILALSVRPIPSEVFLRVMSDKGFCLSAGSACSANTRGKAEQVLQAMGIRPEDRMSAIRISLSYLNTEEEVEMLCSALKETYKELNYGKI